MERFKYQGRKAVKEQFLYHSMSSFALSGTSRWNMCVSSQLYKSAHPFRLKNPCLVSRLLPGIDSDPGGIRAQCSVCVARLDAAGQHGFLGMRQFSQHSHREVFVARQKWLGGEVTAL